MRFEERTKEELRHLLDQLENNLPADRLKVIRSLVDAGEEVIAIEIIVDNLDDLDIELSDHFRAQLARLAHVFDVDQTDRWADFVQRHPSPFWRL